MEILLVILALLTMPIWIPYLMMIVSFLIGVVFGTFEFIISLFTDPN
jgi:hypothetical protein